MNRLFFALLISFCGLAQTSQADEVRRYYYDAMHRLVRVDYVGQGSIQYTYDKLGNRLTESQTLGTAANTVPAQPQQSVTTTKTETVAKQTSSDSDQKQKISVAEKNKVSEKNTASVYAEIPSTQYAQ